MVIATFVKGVALAFAIAVPKVAAIYPGSLHRNPHIHALHEKQLQLDILDANKRPAHNFSVPIDHFHNDTKYEPHSHEFFNVRYWIDDTYYQPGGPVFVIGSGEVTGVARLPYLEYGIGKILSEATGGLTVILEHRYYGTSYPVPDLSTENLRFLTTEQANADTVYFARNIQYPGLEQYNLTSHTTPYILYGGSYAGAQAALARKVYPDDIWGAISGSGVPEVIVDYWEYLEAFRIFGEPACVRNAQLITHIIDNVLLGNDPDAAHTLKSFFGLVDISDVDFAYYANLGPTGLQSTHWDPEIDSPEQARFCQAVTANTNLYTSTRTLDPDVRAVLAAAGLSDQADELLPVVLNWIGYTRQVIKDERSLCQKAGVDVVRCFTKKGSLNNVTIPQDMLRAWTYQTCVQWGYFVTGSGVPRSQSPLVSRLVDLDYASLWCEDAFGIPADPDVDSINRHGGLHFSYPRVAFVDGEHDPWRQAGVHRIGANRGRLSTDSEPFLLIDGAVHHWDQYGARPNATGSWLPPKAVLDAQREEVRFVKVWLREYEEKKKRKENHDGEEEKGAEL